MNILVINCGSSSLKYQLIDSDTEAVLAKGLCERIGIDGSVLTHAPAGKARLGNPPVYGADSVVQCHKVNALERLLNLVY